MPWIPINESQVTYSFSTWYGGPWIEGSVVRCDGSDGGWDLNIDSGVDALLRVSILNYYSPSPTKQVAAAFYTSYGVYYNPIENTNRWEPNPSDFTTRYLTHSPPWEEDNSPSPETYEFLIEVWEDGNSPSPSGSSSVLKENYVYELDKGWTFDGMYIPHFITFNWYFGENPTVYTTMQKVRIHGLSKGVVSLEVQTNGIQTDYREEFSDPEFIDFLNPYEYVSEEFVPATNYADLSNRGLAIQVRFRGRNNLPDRPEPSHVLQALIPQSSPQGSGFSSN